MSGPRYNEFIQSPKVRVIDENGENLGVMFTREAFEQAPKSDSTWSRFRPTPIRRSAKFLDIGKFKYEAQKKANMRARRRRRRKSKRSRCVRISTTTIMTRR